MVRLVTRGRFTQDYAKGLVAAPEDREPAVKKLVESVGAKLINFYFTTGDSDFLLSLKATMPNPHRRDTGDRRSRNDFGHIHCESLDRQGIQSRRGKGFQSSEGVQGARKALKRIPEFAPSAPGSGRGYCLKSFLR